MVNKKMADTTWKRVWIHDQVEHATIQQRHVLGVDYDTGISHAFALDEEGHQIVSYKHLGSFGNAVNNGTLVAGDVTNSLTLSTGSHGFRNGLVTVETSNTSFNGQLWLEFETSSNHWFESGQSVFVNQANHDGTKVIGYLPDVCLAGIKKLRFRNGHATETLNDLYVTVTGW